jgi:hypothetical protein
MYDWWFGWHLVDSARYTLLPTGRLTGSDSDRYKLWHPLAHQYAWCYPNELDWANKTLKQRYIGSYSFIDEFIGNYPSKFTVDFVDLSSVGFNTSAFDALGIETVVVGKITAGRFVRADST